MTADEYATAALAAFPREVADPFCPHGHVITDSPDRRLLWDLAHRITPISWLHELARALTVYLTATCTHHDHHHPAEGGLPAFAQCLWCDRIEWSDVP